MIMRVPFRAALQRALGLPRSAWGTAFAHFGIGVTLLGIVSVTAWGVERIVEVKPGETLEISHYRVTFNGLFERPGPNYHDAVGLFTIHRASGEYLGNMEPSRRTFPSRDEVTTEAALMTRGFSQLYLSLGDPGKDGSVAVRLYYKPHVLMIWLGAGFMFIGGGIVAVGSAVACRRAAAGQGQACGRGATGGVGCGENERHQTRRDQISAGGDAGRRAVAGGLGGRAQRDAVRPGARSTGASFVARIALSGVSERIDRRFRGVARA